MDARRSRVIPAKSAGSYSPVAGWSGTSESSTDETAERPEGEKNPKSEGPVFIGGVCGGESVGGAQQQMLKRDARHIMQRGPQVSSGCDKCWMRADQQLNVIPQEDRPSAQITERRELGRSKSPVVGPAPQPECYAHRCRTGAT